MSLGYARPLEAPDLWKLQDHRSSAVISDKILTSFEKRKVKADAFNERLDKGEVKPGLRKTVWWTLRGNKENREKEWRKSMRKRASLTMAMNDSIFVWFWSAGVLKVLGDTAQVTSPLLVKVYVSFSAPSTCFMTELYGVI